MTSKQELKFIVWADTHWDKFGAKCVTIQDTDQAERAIFQRAKEGQFDFTLFCGDRYLKREPDDEVKVRADRIIFDYVNGQNIPHYHLIGNHDWVDNTRRWHTAESLKLFNNVFVMDQQKSYHFSDMCLIHSLPADVELDLSQFKFDNNKLNIFAFHDTVRGTYMDEDRKMKFENGIALEAFDIPQFDIVFAGDIHIRQKFPLMNTRGGYLGSLVQRTRADANKPRGWTEVRAYRDANNCPWNFDIKFVPTSNLFTRLVFEVGNATKFGELFLDPNLLTDQLVEVKLCGNKVNVDRMADDESWKKLEKTCQARKIDVIRAYETEQSQVVVDLTASDGIIDDLELYLKSKFSNTGSIKLETIVETVKKLKEN